MKTMTWEEIDRDWSGLQKRHRMEIAHSVAKYCIGHKMQEVGKRLGYEEKWIRVQLDYAGIGEALGRSAEGTPLPITGSTNNVANEVPRIIREFGPVVTVQLSDDGHGNQSVSKIEGKDAKAFEPYLDHYLQQGHEPAAAIRLSKAEWAGETAIEKGVIKRSVNKLNQQVNQILFPSAEKENWQLDFDMHMARVQAAARFLNDSKMNFLKRKSTCERVASINEEWLFQVERITNLNPTLQGD